MGWGYNGFKLRTLFVVPHADDRTFVYGVNFEFSVNAKRWDPRTSRPKCGRSSAWHLGRLDLIFNPILDTSYDGLGNPDFAPPVRVAWNPNKKLALAVEEYADYGPLNGFYSGSQQSHPIYGVLDYGFKHLDLEAGAGVGLTSASDKFTLKLIVSYDFNKGKSK